MAYRDLRANVDAAFGLAPAARTNGTATGSSVDLRGYESAMVIVHYGAWTDGTHTPSLQSSTDGTTWNAVGTADLQGTFTALSGTAGQAAIARVGYIGGDRFIRPLIVTASATTGALSGVAIARGKPLAGPLS